jgi:hypothetical protein
MKSHIAAVGKFWAYVTIAHEEDGEINVLILDCFLPLEDSSAYWLVKRKNVGFVEKMTHKTSSGRKTYN